MLQRMLEALAWGVGVTFVILALMWVVDRLHPIDFRAEIEKGNVAAAIYFGVIAVVIGATMIAMAIS